MNGFHYSHHLFSRKREEESLGGKRGGSKSKGVFLNSVVAQQRVNERKIRRKSLRNKSGRDLPARSSPHSNGTEIEFVADKSTDLDLSNHDQKKKLENKKKEKKSDRPRYNNFECITFSPPSFPSSVLYIPFFFSFFSPSPSSSSSELYVSLSFVTFTSLLGSQVKSPPSPSAILHPPPFPYPPCLPLVSSVSAAVK